MLTNPVYPAFERFFCVEWSPTGIISETRKSTCPVTWVQSHNYFPNPRSLACKSNYSSFLRHHSIAISQFSSSFITISKTSFSYMLYGKLNVLLTTLFMVIISLTTVLRANLYKDSNAADIISSSFPHFMPCPCNSSHPFFFYQLILGIFPGSYICVIVAKEVGNMKVWDNYLWL